MDVLPDFFLHLNLTLLPMKQTDMLKACYLGLKNSSMSGFNKWQGVTDQIIKACVTVEIAMVWILKPTLESCFQGTCWLTQTPGFNTVFTKDEYQLIRSFIFPIMMMNHQRLIGLQKSVP